MVVSLPGNIHGWEILPTRIAYSSNRHFQFEDNNVDFTHVQPHYNRVWQVEPCHKLV